MVDMEARESRICRVCSEEFDPSAPLSLYAEAGEWLSEEVWHDAGKLCPRCRENRATLVMMYGHDYNI